MEEMRGRQPPIPDVAKGKDRHCAVRKDSPSGSAIPRQPIAIKPNPEQSSQDKGMITKPTYSKISPQSF